MCVQRRCVHCGAALRGLVMLKHVVAHYEMWRNCCSASSAIVLCFTGLAVAHSQTQLKCASYLAVHPVIKLRYFNFAKTDFSVTEFLTEKYFLVYFFTFVKGCHVSRRVISEESAAGVLKNVGSEFTLNSTIWTKVLHISEHPKLPVFRIYVFFLCIFFIFLNLAYVFLLCFES